MKSRALRVRASRADVNYLKNTAATRVQTLSDFLRTLINEGLVARRLPTLEPLKVGRPRKNL